jgi:hypothetical protein
MNADKNTKAICIGQRKTGSRCPIAFFNPRSSASIRGEKHFVSSSRRAGMLITRGESQQRLLPQIKMMDTDKIICI